MDYDMLQRVTSYMRLYSAGALLLVPCTLWRTSYAFVPPTASRFHCVEAGAAVNLDAMGRGAGGGAASLARPLIFARKASVEPQEGEPIDAVKAAEEAAEMEKALEERQAREMEELKEELSREKRSKLFTAGGSVMAAMAVFFYQHLHPVEAVTLLRQMQQESPAIQTVVANGRPTLVDFYAEWCENCKEMAPTLRQIEGRYKNKVNFVVINGDTPQAADMVEKFRVDGIPHFALISPDGEVRTALVGKIPKQVMEADLDALITGADLPYEGYDAFEDEDHFVFR